MKKIIVLFSIMFFAAISFAQNCEAYIPTAVGSKVETQNFDEKDKFTGSCTTEVLSVSVVDGKQVLVVESESFDNKAVSSGKVQLTYYCTDEGFEMDMKSMMNPAQMEGFEDMTITYNTDNLIYPKVMTAGMTIPDGFVEYVISNQGMNLMTSRLDITDVKVLAVESITVPAGTYTAYKVSSNILSKSGFVKINMKSIQWMVPGVGTVRSETYNSKDKLVSYSVISKIS
jgi:hypothetical protein